MSKSYCRLDPNVYIARIYKDEVDTEEPLSAQGKYECSAIITISGKVATVSAMHGKVSRRALFDMKDQLKAVGVEVIEWERHTSYGVVFKRLSI